MYFEIDDIKDMHANIVSASYNSGVCYASIFGYIQQTKNMLKLLKKKKCTFNVHGRYFTSYPDDYNIYTTKVPDSDFNHTIIFKKDKVYVDSSGVENYNGYIYREISKENLSLYPGYDNDAYRDIDSFVFPEDLLNSIFNKIYSNSSLPILKEWTEYITYQLFKKRYISTLNFEMEQESNDDYTLIGYVINVPIPSLIEIISSGLKNHDIYIDKNLSLTPSDSMKAIEGLDGYLNTFSDVLAEKVQNSFIPRFIPNQNNYSQELLDFIDYVSYKRKIKLYPAQKDVIQAVSNCLDDKNAAFIIGSCGTGKTVMGTGVVMVNNKNKKKMTNIIMCPAHLVNKWKKEIELSAPLSEAYIISNLKDLLAIVPKIKQKKYKKNIWLILSKESAKFGYEERPSAIWSYAKKGYICPECGKPLFNYKYEGRGRNRVRKIEFFNESSFLKHTFENNVCMNKIKKFNNIKGAYEEVECNAKLWEPCIKDSLFDWVKLGKQGWIEKKLINQLKNKLDNKNMLSRNERELLKAINDTLDNEYPIQKAPKKYPIAKYIRKYLKNYIDYFIADEMHQLKGADSAQGEAFGDLAFAANKVIGLTGTLLNGYASGLFYILYRTFPKLMKKEDFLYTDDDKFTTEYGVIKKTSKYKWENGIQKDKFGVTKVKALPGVSPLVFTKFLLENAAFISQEDISSGLPAYTEIPVPIEMDDDLRSAYNSLETEVQGNIKGGFNLKIMGQLIQTLSIYPDMPYNVSNVIHPDTGEVIVEPPSLDSSVLRNKEARLLELVKRKKEAGEKVLVYYHWTNKTDLDTKLPALLESEGIKTAVLKSSVKAEIREEWIKKQLNENIDVLICNPTLIETGLDLLDFTTIIYYQMGYNLYTMRQASRRSWRLSQTKDVEVYFLYYKKTIQEQALSLMATKLQASMAIEGKFSEEGLNALSNNEDIFSQIASSVAEGIKDTVDINVFKKISVNSTIEPKKEYQKNTSYNNMNKISYSCFIDPKKINKKKIISKIDGLELKILNNPILLFKAG